MNDLNVKTTSSAPEENINNVILDARDIVKTFGSTTAVNHIDFCLGKGEVIGLVGANGAGKSTLIKVLSGIHHPDSGTLTIDGKDVDFKKYSPIGARENGIRVVHQELSLCKNLTVYENFYVEQAQELKKDIRWRKKAIGLAQKALDEVFPNSGINVKAQLGDISIAHQQMVEIARATLDPRLKILVLDEPTSSLSFSQTEQLQEYIKKKSAEGLSFIYISHRLKEITYLSDRVFMMRNGKNIYNGAAADTTEEDMIVMMGNSMTGTESAFGDAPKTVATAAEYTDLEINSEVEVKFNDFSNKSLKHIDIGMNGGQIVGITGLDGNGQLELLHAIFAARNNKSAGKKAKLNIQGTVAYVAGDRKKEGIFPIWSITDNMILSRITRGNLFKFIKDDGVCEIIDPYYDELAIKAASKQALITSLSGGNQQKVLIARALCSNADIILLDDPTRGVDIGTKYQLYEIFYKAAKEGKLVIWRTSDDAELEYCTRLLIMSDGNLKGAYNYGEITHEEILKISFAGVEDAAEKSMAAKEKKKEQGSKQSGNVLIGVGAMLVLYFLAASFSPALFKFKGLQLVLSGTIPLYFAALSQTFIVGLGQINMSVGYFMGFMNVLCVTVLYNNTVLGIVVIAAVLVIYSLMGALIHWKNVPSIVITLGMSFVWYGASLILMPQPGGACPAWMQTVFAFKLGSVRGSILITILCVIIAVLIYKSKFGTIMRGFGNNENAMQNSGWSRLRVYWSVYLISGLFCLMGGILLSAATGAGDAAACESYTMLSVASVIIGGGYFNGGRVNHIGSIVGAVTLTFISVLLGVIGVSTDFTSAVQGVFLLVILSLRLFRKEVAA